MPDKMETQRLEFEAMAELAKQWRRIQMTPIVDDDYPEVRHGYESALNEFLRKCFENGRQMPSRGNPRPGVMGWAD